MALLVVDSLLTWVDTLRSASHQPRPAPCARRAGINAAEPLALEADADVRSPAYFWRARPRSPPRPPLGRAT